MSKFFLSLFVLLLAAAPSSGQGWRGLVPLQSTAADVEHTLGPPTAATSPEHLAYELEDETIFIDLSKGTCESAGPDALNVLANVVIRILVIPRKVTLLAARADEFKKSAAGYREETSGGSEEHKFHYFDNDTRVVETYKGDIRSITYQPAAGNEHLRCFASFAEWMKANQIGCMRSLDEYGDIRFEDEQARLDNYAIALQHEPHFQGYIVAYGGRRARAGEARKRAERAKNYLVKVRDLDPRRIMTLDGGHREELSVTLYMWPLGQPGPSPAPTVDPSEVEIIPEKPKARRRKS